MYRSFDLRITNEELGDVIENNSTERLKLWKRIGWQSKQEFDYEYKELLKDYLNNGVLNGTELIEKVFKNECYGYDEKDFEIAYELPKNNMIYLDVQILKEWIRINWRLNKCKNQKLRTVEDLEVLKYEKHHPLNILYKIVEEKLD